MVVEAGRAETGRCFILWFFETMFSPAVSVGERASHMGHTRTQGPIVFHERGRCAAARDPIDPDATLFPH